MNALNKSTLLVPVLFLALLGMTTPSRADGDIVYSARVYEPYKATHFHLYRINPDGTGERQITNGPNDDNDPTWSPDGRWIMFIRSIFRAGSMHEELWIVDPDGRNGRQMAAVTNNGQELRHAEWWPDSRRVVIPAAGKCDAELIDIGGSATRDLGRFSEINFSTDYEYASVVKPRFTETDKVYGLNLKRFSQLPSSVGSAIWVGPSALVSVDDQGEGDAPDILSAYFVSGTKLWSRTILPENSDIPVSYRFLQRIPGDRFHLLMAAYDDIPRAGRPAADYYRVDVDTGKASPWLTGASFIVFEPVPLDETRTIAKGRSPRYLTVLARRANVYGQPHNSTSPEVWTGSLMVGDGPTVTSAKSIASGFLLVDAADWRSPS